MHGAPPAHPGDLALMEFADYIHDLAMWTQACRETYMEWEGLDEDTWLDSENITKRELFEVGFLRYAYTLKRED